MKSNSTKVFLCSLGIVILSGCASIFNPYEDEFQCPETYNGKCISLGNAYRESVEGIDYNKPENCSGKDCNDNNGFEAVRRKSHEARLIFQEKMYQRLTGLINEPEPPVVVPPKVVRVLILSYTDQQNVMLGYRHAYFFATQPKWMFSTHKQGGS